MTDALGPITSLSENNTSWLSTSMAEKAAHLLGAAFMDYRFLVVVTLVDVIDASIGVAVTSHFAEGAYISLQYPAPALSATAIFALAWMQN